MSVAFKGPDKIETARMVLRRPCADDAEGIFSRYAGDPTVTRYMSWPTHRTVQESLAFVAWSDAEWDRWPAGPYLVFARQDGRLLGSTGLAFEAEQWATAGYVFARDAWGQGYATEALRAMVDLARALRVSTLEAACHAEHLASAHVLKKCGFHRVRILREEARFPNLAPGRRCDALRYQLSL